MIIGSHKGPFTPHGILGYSATLTMVSDLVLIWRCYYKNGIDSIIKDSILLYSKIAYGWWLIAYLTGSLIVLWK